MRCCSKNAHGKRCESNCKFHKKQGRGKNEMVTLAVAQARCAGMGRRLCTAEELKGNKCCNTGCNYDDELTWQLGGFSESGNNNQGKKTHCIGLFLQYGGTTAQLWFC